MHPDSFGSRSRRTVGGISYGFFRLEALQKRRIGKVSRLPFSIKVLLENLLRHEDGVTVSAHDIRALANWSPEAPSDSEIAFRPARVLLQDFSSRLLPPRQRAILTAMSSRLITTSPIPTTRTRFFFSRMTETPGSGSSTR